MVMDNGHCSRATGWTSRLVHIGRCYATLHRRIIDRSCFIAPTRMIECACISNDLTERSLHPFSRGLIATSMGRPLSMMTRRATYRAGQRDGRGSQFGGSEVRRSITLSIWTSERELSRLRERLGGARNRNCSSVITKVLPNADVCPGYVDCTA